MELGIDSKDKEINDLLCLLSRSDFHHDFAKIKMNTIYGKLLSSENIKSKTKDYIKRVTEFKSKSENKSIYDYFEKTNLLLPSENKEYLSEINILEKIIGLNMSGIKRELINKEDSYGLQKEMNKYKVEDIQMPPTNKPFDINYKNKILRKYQYSCYPAKVRGEYFNLPFAFRKLANNRNFVLLIDSSYFSIKKMKRREIVKTILGDNYDEKQTYTFYIIKNNETMSDSAVKLETFDKGNEKIKIKILKDLATNESIYPEFSNVSQAANLYSSILMRTKKDLHTDKINGTIKYKDGKLEFLEDLGNISEKETSSFLALQKNLTKPFDSDDVLVHFFLKRSGDWCQALSLLDGTREYEIYDYDTNVVESKTTLDTLKRKLNCEVALITHDSVLLAYSLLLGINVFYSIRVVSQGVSKNSNEEDSKSIIWMTYFKNVSDSAALDASILEEINDEYLNKIKNDAEFINTLKNTAIKELKELALPEVPQNVFYNALRANNTKKRKRMNVNSNSNSTNYNTHFTNFYITYFTNFIITMRKNLLLLANLISKETILEQLDELEKSTTRLKSKTKTDKDMLANLFNLSDMKNKIDEYVNINNSLKNIYTDLEKDKVTIKNFIKSEANKKEFEEILNKLHEDYKASVYLFTEKSREKNYIQYDIDFFDIIPFILELKMAGYSIPTRRSESIKLCKAILMLRNSVLAVGLPQHPINNNACSVIDDRRTRAAVGAYEGGSKKILKGGNREMYNSLFINNVGERTTPYINDDNGHFYSVVNNTIIIREQKPLLEELLNSIDSITTKEDKYVVLRFLLCYLDELYTAIFSISANKEDRDDDTYLNYLYIQAQVFNIQMYLYKDESFSLKHVKSIQDIFFTDRYKWTPLYIENFILKLRGNYYDIEQRINTRIQILKEKIVKEIDMLEISNSNSNNENTNNNIRNKTKKLKRNTNMNLV